MKIKLLKLECGCEVESYPNRLDRAKKHHAAKCEKYASMRLAELASIRERELLAARENKRHEKPYDPFYGFAAFHDRIKDRS